MPLVGWCIDEDYVLIEADLYSQNELVSWRQTKETREGKLIYLSGFKNLSCDCEESVRGNERDVGSR